MGVRLRSAALEALDRCVDTAISEQVDAVLIAGDLFDGTRLSFGTERLLLTRLARLADEGIQVVYATGNHDPGDGTRTGKPGLAGQRHRHIDRCRRLRTHRARRRRGRLAMSPAPATALPAKPPTCPDS